MPEGGEKKKPWWLWEMNGAGKKREEEENEAISRGRNFQNSFVGYLWIKFALRLSSSNVLVVIIIVTFYRRN